MSWKINKDARLLLLILGGFLASLASCRTEQECFEPVNVNVVTGFMSVTIDSVDSPISIIGQDTITIKVPRTNYRDTALNAARMIVLGEDKIFVIGSAGSTMRPLLNPAKDSIRYSYTLDTTTNLLDTITFYYTPLVHFVSNNCGYTYYFTLSGIKTTYNGIDSIALLKGDVTNGSSDKNVMLYFKR